MLFKTSFSHLQGLNSKDGQTSDSMPTLIGTLIALLRELGQDAVWSYLIRDGGIDTAPSSAGYSSHFCAKTLVL
jgi:hypothetical protein